MMIIQTPTPDIAKSLNFYKKLNFTKVSNENEKLVTDGKLLIEVNDKRTARIEIKLFMNSLPLEALKKHTCIVKTDNGTWITDYSGVWIHVLNENKKNSMDLPEVNQSTLGNYSGISIETPDITHSMKLWQLLGFDPFMGEIEQGWLSLKNENEDVISLMAPFMCPHLFFNPSLTFFNGKKNLEIIKEIKSHDIDISEEITHFNDKGIADNIIIRDPGGLGMFVFSDEG